MKTTSRLALIAASGMLLAAAMTPAKAADLGGGCCADLEERVAELEATTARKGNRVVSLQVYGQVNKGLLIWDDGVDSDAFVVDNTTSSSRFGFKGKAKIASGWSAGYQMEFELNDARADAVRNVAANDDIVRDQAGDDRNNRDGSDAQLNIRHNNFYIESDKLGRITVGQGSTAADGAFEIVLSESGSNSDVTLGRSLYVRTSVPGVGGRQLDDWANNFDSSRDDVIRYDSPSIYGFILSASWGDNDYADVAVRFKKEFGAFRVAAALAYQWDTTNNARDFETFGGSISVMHVPTGIYTAFQASSRDYELATQQDGSFWYAQAGIEKKFTSLGATTIYGEYGVYSDTRRDTLNTDREATRLGFGINQKIDAAAMDIYAHATTWSFDDNTLNNYEDLSTIMIGSRIKF